MGNVPQSRLAKILQDCYNIRLLNGNIMNETADNKPRHKDCAVTSLEKVHLKKNISQQQIKFYLKSCKYFRFPFFDPTNCYRRDGLFGQLEDCLTTVGEELSRRYGRNFISINLRGSWLRGIPTRGDDVDVLYIVDGLSDTDVASMRDYTAQSLRQSNQLFRMCEGKIENSMKVFPIFTLDLSSIRTIMNSYMYGLGLFLRRNRERSRDTYQDSFMGSTLTEKKSRFLKSGILIPYVGWLYGRERKQEVFDELARHLPVPTQPTMLYSMEEIDEAKETLRQAFIARNLIYPSLEIKKLVDLKTQDTDDLKQEAMDLYQALHPLDEVYTRAIVNYMYTLKIEERLLEQVITRERVRKFAPNYDSLVFDILEMAYLRVAKAFSSSD